MASQRQRPLSTHFSPICDVNFSIEIQGSHFSALQVSFFCFLVYAIENCCNSAGIGRTGVIILSDIMLRMSDTKGAVDFYNCLVRLRQERPNIVPNFDLYKLAHLIVLAVRNGNFCCFFLVFTKAFLTSSIVVDTRIKNNIGKSIEKILRERRVINQIEYIKESAWQDEPLIPENCTSKVPIIFEKNRIPQLLPQKICQVHLNGLPSSTSASRYINAIDVGGVIVTQHPLTNTVSDFWRMVSEQECNVIVNLNLPANSVKNTK